MPGLEEMPFTLTPRVQHAALSDRDLNLIAKLVEADELFVARQLARSLGFELIHRASVRSRPKRPL